MEKKGNGREGKGKEGKARREGKRKIREIKRKNEGWVTLDTPARNVLCQASLFIYDEGLIGGDKELANALWRRFFSKDIENQVGFFYFNFNSNMLHFCLHALGEFRFNS